MDDCWIGMPTERFEAYGPRIAPLYDTEQGGAPRDSTGALRLTRPSPGANAVGPMAQLGHLSAARLGGGAAEGPHVLGEIAQRLVGEPFTDIVRRRVFLPLGMDDCWIGMPTERFEAYGPRIAPLYDTEQGGAPHDSTGALHLTRPSPGANAVGPMAQLGHLYAALLAGGAADGHHILGKQTVEALVARHRVGLWDHTFRHHLDWGLGLIVNSGYHGEETSPYGYGPHASLRAFGHSGYRSGVGFADPEHGLVVCLWVNGTPEDEAHRRRFHAVTAAVYEDLGIAG
jgi:CubicO group peptidase (beta-lactamase class C family)